MRVQTGIRAAVVAAAAALMAAGCAPGPTPGRSAVADGVRFDYALGPQTSAGTYRLTLALADAKTGVAIDDANVAVDIYGPGIDGGSTLVNLTKAEGPPSGYVAEAPLPQAASYRLTFQVNRRMAPGAQAVFTTTRPAAG
jgi:hypothetical protein